MARVLVEDKTWVKIGGTPKAYAWLLMSTAQEHTRAQPGCRGWLHWKASQGVAKGVVHVACVAVIFEESTAGACHSRDAGARERDADRESASVQLPGARCHSSPIMNQQEQRPDDCR